MADAVGVCVPFVSAETNFVIKDVQSTGVAGGVGVFGMTAAGVIGIIFGNAVAGDVLGICGAFHTICDRDGFDGLRTKFISAGGWNILLL